jgi:DNA uptake protein ComE-like DNA-binding protein
MDLTVAILFISLSRPALGRYQDRDQSGIEKTSANAPPSEARVDLNHATIAQLERIPGLQHTWAGRIVRFRPYRTKQDLMEKGVVNSEVYDRIKDFVIAHHDRQ